MSDSKYQQQSPDASSAHSTPEQAPREIEKNFRKAQAMAHLGYWEWDILNNSITWSDEIYRIYGIDPETPLTYERLMQSVHPGDRQYHDKHTAEWLENRGGDPFEYRIIRPDGSMRYVYATGEVECDASGEPARFTGIIQDVTELELRKRALEESEARFRATFEQAAVGVAHVALDGRFLRINGKFCDIVGYSQDEMQLLTFQDITYPADLDADLQYVQQLRDGEIATYSMEKRYIRKDAEIVWVNLTASLIRKDNGEPDWFVAVVENITKRKLAEQAILDYQRRLKSLAADLTRTEERERRTIAAELHDHIGQSLAVMGMQLAAAKKEVDGRKVGSTLDEVSNSLREVIRNTRNIMTGLSSPALHELGLSAAISDWLREQIGDRYGLQAQFHDEGEPEPLSVDAKAILFRNVRELLMNVVKYAGASRVTVSMQCDDCAVRIVVEDDGRGMPTPTSYASKADEGGFGLFSIDERMSDLGGTLVIDSSPGRGVRAILTAPLELE